MKPSHTFDKASGLASEEHRCGIREAPDLSGRHHGLVNLGQSLILLSTTLFCSTLLWKAGPLVLGFPAAFRQSQCGKQMDWRVREEPPPPWFRRPSPASSTSHGQEGLLVSCGPGGFRFSFRIWLQCVPAAGLVTHFHQNIFPAAPRPPS